MNQVELKKRQVEMFSHILGMLCWLIIGNLLGQNGIAYFAFAFEAYLFFQMLLTHMLADTLGRLIRSRNVKGQYKNVAKFKRNILTFELAAGGIGSVFLFVIAGFLSETLLRLSYSVPMIWILAPMIFLRSMVSLLLGYFQGEGTELPTVIAYIMRQICTLLFGLLFINLFGKYGNKVSALLRKDNFTAMYSGLGMATAILVSEILVLLFLFLVYRGSRGSVKKGTNDGMRVTDTFGGQVRALTAGRIPFAFVAMLGHFPIWLGLLFFRKHVSDIVELEQYGVFYGKYLPVVVLLIAIALIALLGCCHRVAGYVRKEEQRYTRNYFAGGFHTGMLYGLFLSLFAGILAPQLADVIGGLDSALAGKMLQQGSFVILFAILGFYFTEILLLLNGRFQVIAASALKDVVFVITLMLLLNHSSIGILALVYAGILAEAVFAVATGVLLCRQLKLGIDWVRQLAIPAGSACVTGLLLWLINKGISPHLGSVISIFLCLVIGLVCYALLLLLLRDFREQDLNYIPGGKLLRRIGQLLRVY